MEDKELQKKFTELHHQLVNMVCRFAKENALTNVENMALNADGLTDSITDGKWHPSTDSELVLFDKNDNIILTSV